MRPITELAFFILMLGAAAPAGAATVPIAILPGQVPAAFSLSPLVFPTLPVNPVEPPIVIHIPGVGDIVLPHPIEYPDWPVLPIKDPPILPEPGPPVVPIIKTPFQPDPEPPVIPGQNLPIPLSVDLVVLPRTLDEGQGINLRKKWAKTEESVLNIERTLGSEGERKPSAGTIQTVMDGARATEIQKEAPWRTSGGR